MIRVVFLDIDDTLLSFSASAREAMREGFARFGIAPFCAEMYPVFERINDGLWRQMEAGTLSYAEFLKIRWNLVFEALGISFDGRVFEAYFQERLFTSAIPEPGAVGLLGYLAPKYPLCIAGNGLYEQQINRLRTAKLDGYFKHIFISSAVGARKPDKAFFDHCFRVLRKDGFPDLLPGETLLIGDSLSSDIAGGRAYGMHTCLYRKSLQPGEDTGGAEYAVTDLAEVRSFL